MTDVWNVINKFPLSIFKLHPGDHSFTGTTISTDIGICSKNLTNISAGTQFMGNKAIKDHNESNEQNPSMKIQTTLAVIRRAVNQIAEATT